MNPQTNDKRKQAFIDRDPAAFAEACVLANRETGEHPEFGMSHYVVVPGMGNTFRIMSRNSAVINGLTILYEGGEEDE